jgi:hypothetical protein
MSQVCEFANGPAVARQGLLESAGVKALRSFLIVAERNRICGEGRGKYSNTFTLVRRHDTLVHLE